jgi:HPt (histidine-containing phosphotransfer) domain-containing protein
MEASQAPIIVAIDEDIKELIPKFMENRRADIGALKDLLAQGNFAEIQRLGHKIKGTGSNFGFAALSDIGLGIETAAIRRDASGVGRSVGVFSDYMEKVKIVYE